MKLKMESKEIKDLEMGMNCESDSQHEEDSVEDTSGTSINQPITHDGQLTLEIASNSKEEGALKRKSFKAFMPGINEGFGKGLLRRLYLEDSKRLLNSAESQQDKVPSAEENIPASMEEKAIKVQEPEESNKILNIGDSKNHRQNIHYSSESSDFETDESSDSDEFFKNLHKNVVLPTVKVPAVVKTKGELLPIDLPPVEDLQITENVTNLQKIGKILHTVINPDSKEFYVIVESDGNSNPLDEDSVLFLSSGEPLGKVHDVYGNVNKPTYIVRYNKPEDIHNKGVTKNQDVYYSPSNDELTHYVLVDHLKQQKGSDASWKDNNEPPEDQIDYSDDEQEKLAKQKQRAKNRKNDRNWDSEEEDKDVAVAPNKMEKKHVTYNQERASPARPSRNKFRSPIPGPSRSSPHSYSSPRSFGSTPSPPSIFNPGTSSLQRNALSQPCGPMSSNTRFGSFPQRSVPSPQSFGPYSRSYVPTSIPFGHFPQGRVPTPPSFSQSSVPSYQSFTAPPTSHVLIPSNLFVSNATGAPQQNPSYFMPAPQNNVPLQQQFLVQSQQPVGNLSQPPPNYNTNHSRTFLHQNHSFTPPMFGALPTAARTIPNTSNQSFANQILCSFGTTNGPHNDLSGNLNISQSRNITPMNSNGHQGPSYGMTQSSPTNSFIFPQRNTQHNNIHTPVTQPIFGPNQSPCPTPPFIPNQSTLPSPCPTPPFVLCPTPPPLPTQQGFSVMSNPHPPVLQSQTSPHTIHQFSLNLPVVRNPVPPQNYPYS